VGLSVVIIPSAYRVRMVAAVKVAPAVVLRPVYSEHVIERGRSADISTDLTGF
jgi:hypothetical protein